MEEEKDPQAAVIKFLAGKGLVHKEAINVPFDAETIQNAVTALKSAGKLNSDGDRIWLP